MAAEAENPLIKGRYRLLSKLGAGGMGNVWLADDTMLGRRVALKELVLSPRGEDLPVRRERALREARAAASIEHPGVVDIYDVFLENGRPWIVMAYIRGRSLLDLVEEGRLDERGLARIGVRALDALNAAHRAEVLHRDIKPANIVIGARGGVFLVDFGIARIGGQSDLTSHNSFPGTPEFMAPERIKGRVPGPPSDLWSLGVTFFYALEGHSPFHRDNPVATMGAVISQDPPPLSRPGPLADAVVRLLEKDPERRMNGRELLAVLKAVATDRPHRAAPSRPVPAAPPPPPPPPPPPGPPPAPSPVPAPPPVPVPVRPPAPEPPAHRVFPPPSPPLPPPSAPPASPSRSPASEAPGRSRPAGAPPSAPPATPPAPPAPAAPSARPVLSEAAPPPSLRGRTPAEAARVVGGMAAGPAARLLATLRGETAREVLTLLDPRTAARILLALSGDRAASLLSAIPARAAGGLLERMAALPERAAAVLQMLSATRAGHAVDHMRLDEAATLLALITPDEAARILAHAHVRTAAGAVGALSSPSAAARLIEAMPVRRAREVLGYVPPATTARLLRASSGDHTGRLLDGLDPRTRANVLRYLGGS